MSINQQLFYLTNPYGGDNYVRVYWYENVGTSTSGTLSAPSGGSLVLGQWPNDTDAIASEAGTDGAPSWIQPEASDGTAVTATLDSSGNWTLSDTPTNDTCIVFCYRVEISNLEGSKTIDKIENEPEISGGGGLSWSIISSNTTASVGNGYLVDVSGGSLTLTLPGSPSTGDKVGVCDFYGNSGTNAITIDRNGNNIEGASSNYTISTNGKSIVFCYSDSTRGWEIIHETGGSGAGDMQKSMYDPTTVEDDAFDHRNFTNVNSDQHHSRYADSEARSALHGQSDLGNLGASPSPTLTPGWIHTATVDQNLDTWDNISLSDGDVVTLRLSNSGSYTVSTTGLTAATSGGLSAIEAATVDLTIWQINSTRYAIATEVP